jgi:hypothetical protein
LRLRITIMLVLVTTGTVAALPVLCRSATIVREITPSAPVVTGKGATCVVEIENSPQFAEPGEPLLPSYPVRVVLPQGEEVYSLTVKAFDEEEITIDRPVEWGQPQAPRSMEASWERVLADPEIYQSDRPFPQTRAVHVTTQTYKGYNIAFFRVYPVTYIASESRLRYSRRLELTIETVPSEAMLARSKGTLRPGVAGDLSDIRDLLGEDVSMPLYTPPAGISQPPALVDPGDTYPFVIITSAAMEPAFESLKAVKDSRGMITKVVRVQQIVWNYEGSDLQERIRKFIKDAYLYWETEYVLLGGDDELIPHRGLYAEILPYVTDDDIPADIYYAGLDGTWNDDGDGRWGEPGEADLLPEVSLARVCPNDLIEATNFVNKVIRYETAPVVSQIKTAQLAGELIYDEPTWGADDKEEIHYGTSAHGFTTAGIPPSFTVDTLYDRDLYPDEWDKYDLIALLNSGRHLVNHSGHCINWTCMKISTSDIPVSFTNDGISNTYMVIYAHGCYSGAFDNRTTDGSYVGDAVAEYFTFIENGAVAYIGNSRYGCGFHGDTRSAAQFYDRQFFDAIFGEGITAIGDTQNDSKIDNIPYIDFRCIRWSYYTLNLFGDPTMDIWTDTPADLVASIPPVIHVGANEVEIAVTDGTEPVEGARVTVFGDSTYCCHGFTDGAGIVYLDPAVDTAGSLYVAVSAHNFYSRIDTVPVVDAAGPLVMLESVTIDDDNSGQSNGNADGVVDAGETIETAISLRNAGQDTASAVSGVLRARDGGVVLIDSSGIYADIPPGQVANPTWSYAYEVSPSAADGGNIALELAISYSDTSVVRHFSVPVAAPDLGVSAVSIDDSAYGNGDGCIQAGEGFAFDLHIANGGSGEAAGLDVIVSESDPYAVLLADSAHISLIGAGEEGQTGPVYLVTLGPDCPEFHRIDLEVTTRLASGRQATGSTAVYVGGTLDEDFEGAGVGWTHSEIVKGFVDQWHLEDYRNHTQDGDYCWKFGGPGAEGYAHYAHGALVTPELCLGSNAVLTFWHWIHAELESGNYASDGAIVEISTDGCETWSEITPAGGYTHLIYPGTSTPIPPETPCFGWTDDWTQVEFDLSGYTGPARIRFNFGGGEDFENEEGWYVDDVVVTDDYAGTKVETTDLERVPMEFGLLAPRPNPVSSDVRIGFDVPHTAAIKVRVFDIQGREVETLVDAVLEPGRYWRSWSTGEGVAPGVYFIRMHAAGFAQTRKVVVH